MSEFELLARVRERLPAPGPRVLTGSGDDAAITLPGGVTATSVDALVEGVHFRREHSSLAQIGHKALATALSDLAAMAAGPGEAYVVLGVPTDLDEDGCIEVLDGIVALASATGTSLVGGDVTRAPVLMLAVTVVGHSSSPEELVTRSGAQPGDALVLTGEIGAAAAGLALLEQPGAGDAVPASTAERLRARHLEPQPRIEAGRALAQAGATAMIDLSDGLGGDGSRLAEASGVGLRVNTGSLPIADGVGELAAATGQEAARLAVSGGEDYELLATLPPDRFESARSAVEKAGGIALTKIGEAIEGEGVEIRLPGGELLKPSGFDQLG
ncbi:MAG: thiamine-phosphate kinase [Solirubrobacterales bacterium]